MLKSTRSYEMLKGKRGSKKVDIHALAGAFPEIEFVNEVLTLHMGPDFILVTLSVDFEDTQPASDVERVIRELDAKIKKAFPRVKRVFIEGEARRSSSCG
jgi:divalent metal cation (Fe/Co/Zn/Cd) transporter